MNTGSDKNIVTIPITLSFMACISKCSAFGLAFLVNLY